MINKVKAVIAEGNKTFFGDGLLCLQLSGCPLEEAKAFVRKRKLGIGSPVLFSLDDKEKRSDRQNRTFHLLVHIAYKSDLYGDDEYQIKQSFKQMFGKVYRDWKDFSGKWNSELKSSAEYTKEQFCELMSGSIDHILNRFNNAGYYDARLDEMMQEFNGAKIEKPEEIEIF